MHIQEDDCVVSFWFFVKPSSDNQSHLHVLKHWVSVKTFQQWCILDWFFCNVQYKPLHAHMRNPVSLIHLPDNPKISKIKKSKLNLELKVLVGKLNTKYNLIFQDFPLFLPKTDYYIQNFLSVHQNIIQIVQGYLLNLRFE